MTRPRKPPRLTREQTLRRLRTLDIENGPLTFDWLDKQHRAVVFGAFQHFDSLPAARKAAGVPDPKPSSKWSIERMVNELRAEYRAGVRMTIAGLVDAGRHDLVSAIAQRLGGIQRARRLARIPRPPTLLIDVEPRGSWDEQRVVAEILALYSDGEPLNSAKAPRKLSSAGIRLFGSWQAAIEATGLDYDDIRLQRPAYSKADICEALRKLRRSRPDLHRGGLYSQPFASAVAKLFGSLDVALSAAGIRDWPRWRRRMWNRTQVIAALRANRGAPGTNDRLGEFVRYYFGSMFAARKAAGLPSLRRPWSRQVVVADLRALARRGKYAPDRNLKAACERYFGGVVAARRAAGIVLPPTMWSREKLVELLREKAHKWILLLADPVEDACCNHFGSVTAAREAANLEREISRWPERPVLAALRANFRDPYLLRALVNRSVKLLGLSPRDVLDENEVAARLGVPRGTVQSWRTRGRGGPPHIQLGRLIRYRRPDVDAFVKASKRRAKRDAAAEHRRRGRRRKVRSRS